MIIKVRIKEVKIWLSQTRASDLQASAHKTTILMKLRDRHRVVLQRKASLHQMLRTKRSLREGAPAATVTGCDRLSQPISSDLSAETTI